MNNKTTPDAILVTAEYGAALLSIGESTFWLKVKQNILPPPVKIGGSTRWFRSDLEAAARAMQQPNCPTSPSTPA